MRISEFATYDGEGSGKKFILRMYNKHENQWLDITGPLSKRLALEEYFRRTRGGYKHAQPSDGDYYRIFPAGTRMLYSQGFGGFDESLVEYPTTKAKQKVVNLSREQFKNGKDNGVEFRQAGLYQTLGPHYHHYYMFNKHPYVSNLDHEETMRRCQAN